MCFLICLARAFAHPTWYGSVWVIVPFRTSARSNVVDHSLFSHVRGGFMVLACGEAVDYDQEHYFHSRSLVTLRIFYIFCKVKFYKVMFYTTMSSNARLSKTCFRLLTSVSWYRLDACMQLDIKIHQITNVQVLINVKKGVMKNSIPVADKLETGC